MGYGRCKWHGGSTATGKQYAQRLRAEATARTYGIPRGVDPHTALLEEVHRTAGHVAWLGRRIAAMDPDALVHGVVKTVQQADGSRVVEARAEVMAWLRVYQEERDRLIRAAKAAVDAGVAEREVRVVEAQASLLARIIELVLSDLGHDLTDERTREVVRVRLLEGRELEAGVGGGNGSFN